jgi:SAM-dependent MidA family methyltransferase
LNAELVLLIREKIASDGPQPFTWFMEQALYHPEHGYYTTGRAQIGRGGDYFTNVSVGPLFGQLLALQFIEIWERLGQIDRFIIVEQGAHHAQFARDVLEFVRQRFPEFLRTLRYRIIEPFPKLQDRQREILGAFAEQVQWRKSLETVESFTGVHFSNELLDSMPVNLRHKLVGLDGDKFVFVESTQREPTNQLQLDWIASVAPKLQRGVVLIVDYGFCGDEFREVLQVRSRHRQLNSPFDQIGEADITAHVNWTEIARAAENNGLRLLGFTDQHHFFTGIVSGHPEIAADEKSKRALQTLLHPEMLGRSFQVLGLANDVDLGEALSGFKFARDPRVALGL